MANYDFKTLSYADFEDLARDLVGEELGVRFEAFAEGRDEGIDGRYSSGADHVILQAKHYARSSFATLKSKMKYERDAIVQLNPSKYFLVTSQELTPDKKRKLLAAINLSCISESDIWGATELNALLRKYPKIERAHIKLWLVSSTVLQSIIRATSDTFNKLTYEEIEDKVKVYAPNPSFSIASDILEQNRLLIISGPPGVGKTTLAEMLTFSYVSEGWELNAIKGLDDGFASLDDTRKQIFLFDDFLGQIALDSAALSQKDSDIYRFLRKVSRSPNARFILTTRAYIFEEARRSSEHLASPLLDISKFVLDVGKYSREIRARILYNHLIVHETPQSYVVNLIKSDKLKKVIDHKNYNPRIVWWMTNEIKYLNITPDQYSDYFLSILDNPKRLWDVAFKEHIPNKCRHFLFALFFCEEQGVHLEEIKMIYSELHANLCKKYGDAYGPKDFEEALQILEGSFISIRGKTIDFMNPSLRDYLSDYLHDESLIFDFPESAIRSKWASSLWKFGKKVIVGKDSLSAFSLSFKRSASFLEKLPMWESFKEGTMAKSYRVGLSNVNRISLLLEWWGGSNCDDFCNYALSLAESPIDGLDPWRDADEVIYLIGRIKSKDVNETGSFEALLTRALEQSLKEMMRVETIPTNDLQMIVEASQQCEEFLSADLQRLIKDTVENEFFDVESVVSGIDSVSELEEYIELLRDLGENAGVGFVTIDLAVEEIEDRIAEIEEETSDADDRGPEIHRSEFDADFDDSDIENLFSPLLDSEEEE